MKPRSAMKPYHIMLGILIAVIWGVAFVATKIALDSFSPPQLTTLRFLIASSGTPKVCHSAADEGRN